MKAAGIAQCVKCGGHYRAYKPRGYKPGDQLHVWSHNSGTAWRAPKCPGSYTAGHNSILRPEVKQ